MKQMIDLWKKILTEGETRGDRTGVGTKSIFGGQIEFDLREKFPLVTIKKTLWKSAFIEMLWFIRGDNNTSFLKQHNVPIWDAWADKDGNLGPVYGVQWRKWPGKTVVKTQPMRLVDPSTYEIYDHDTWTSTYTSVEPPIDQLAELIKMIKTNPNGRRHIVTAWNPTYLSEMGLPPCHRDFQCYVTNDGHLDLMMAIRSWDTALGGPFNVAQYALLTHLIARATGLKPRMLKINYGDAHLYLNHVEPMAQLIEDIKPLECKPQLVIKTDNVDIDGYQPDNFDVVGYSHGPFLKLPIAV